MRLGALEVLSKPGAAYTVGKMVDELAEVVRHIAGAKVSRMLADPAPLEAVTPMLTTTQKLLAIGASTGGTVALETILSRMPHNGPGTIITQHMPASFTRAFADRLNDASAMKVKEAESGDTVMPGLALVAPGDRHMVLRRSGTRYFVETKGGPPVNRHRPSVDVMFQSVAMAAGRNAIGAILTGMGADGVGGLNAMREAGAPTFAQDEASCVVFGMPKVALETGAAERAVSLDNMTSVLLGAAQDRAA